MDLFRIADGIRHCDPTAHNAIYSVLWYFTSMYGNHTCDPQEKHTTMERTTYQVVHHESITFRRRQVSDHHKADRCLPPLWGERNKDNDTMYFEVWSCRLPILVHLPANCWTCREYTGLASSQTPPRCALSEHSGTPTTEQLHN